MQVDHFKEEIIVRKQRGMYMLLLTLVTLGMAVTGIFAAIYLFKIQTEIFTTGFNLGDLVIFLVAAAAVVGLFYARVHMRVEYEYTFTNGELDVDRILNGTKREHLFSINLRTVEKMAPVEDESYARYDADAKMKRTYAILNRFSQIYYIVWKDNEERRMLLVEPSRQMVEMMRYYNAKDVLLAPEQ
jgi:hypothetical protein